MSLKGFINTLTEHLSPEVYRWKRGFSTRVLLTHIIKHSTLDLFTSLPALP